MPRRPGAWPGNSRCYEKHAGEAPGAYSMDHSAGTYVIDPAGRLRLFVGYGKAGADLAHDIRVLLNEK